MRFRFDTAIIPLILLAILVASRLHVASAPAQTRDISTTNLRRTPTVQIVERTKDAVVYISTTVQVERPLRPFPNDPFFGQITVGTEAIQVGVLGSGFIVHPDGYIVTNNHVVDRAMQQKIAVELLDGRKFDADLVSADADADLAILRIHADKPLPALDLGDSSDLMPGEPVIAVGNPLGFSHSVSTGIVSAIHRDLQVDNNLTLNDVIQTDTAINRGNSGGPLLNAYGQVIGINTAVSGNAQNIGFAIQVNRLRNLIPQLMNPAQVNKLDMQMQLKEQRKLSPPSNVEASVVRADGDTPLLNVAGRKPRDIVDAYAILLEQKAGRPFEVQFQGQKPTKIEPKVITPPDVRTQVRAKLGIQVEPITPALVNDYRLRINQGVVVTEVVRGSGAEQAQIQPGDVIVQLGGAPVATLTDLGTMVQLLPTSGAMPIRIVRGNLVGNVRLQF